MLDLQKFLKTWRFLVESGLLSALLLSISCSDVLTISTGKMCILCNSSFYIVIVAHLPRLTV